MIIKTFNEISSSDLDKIIKQHFNHWSRYSQYMNIDDTTDKFKNIYANDNNIPYGIAMYDKDYLVGFCVFKENCLEKYPQFTPWISDVMIFPEYRSKGYGKKLIDFAKDELRKKGFNYCYLWTDKAPLFYEKIGFVYVQDVVKNNDDGIGRLYKIDL